MTAALASRPKAHAEGANAPPVMAPPQRRSAPGFAPPIAPLAAIPAFPAVQRKCADCAVEEDDEMLVQPRTRVGPVGDRFEREADSIAAQVMAMRAGAIAAAPASVQRAGGEAGGETVRASERELVSGGGPLPVATRAFFEARMGRALGDVRIHEGGEAQALNASIAARAFTYRNHIWLGAGERAEPGFTMAHELAHVLQQTAPGPVSPAPARVMRTYYYEEKGKSLPTTHDEVVNWATVTDKSTFAEVPVPNYNSRGFATTKRRFGRADLISFTGSTHMVPIGMATAVCPSAQQKYWYCGITSDGAGSRKPATLDVGIDPIRHDGAIWTHHDAQSLPRYGEILKASPKMGFIRDAGGATKAAFPTVTNPGNTVPAPVTTNLAIGDVKAGAFPKARAKAVDQITNYILGFQQAVRHYEDIRKAVEKTRSDMAAAGKNDFSSLPPPLTPWEVTGGILEKIGPVKVVTKLNDKPVPIVLKKWTSDGSGGIARSEPVPQPDPPPPQTMGNLIVWREVGTMKGAWSYLWTPVDSEASARYAKIADDPDFKLHSDEAYCLREALTLPIDKTGKVHPATQASRAPACLKPLRISASAPLVRRNGKKKTPPPPRTDQFADHYKDWTAKQAKLGAAFAAYQAGPKGKERAAAMAELEARQNIADVAPAGPIGLGMRKPQYISDKGKALLHEQGVANFWLETMSGRSGAMLGSLRKRFGNLFIKLFNGYQNMKERVATFLVSLKPDSTQSDRLGRVALRIVIRILAAFAGFVFPQITQALTNCAEEGVRAKIDSLFADGPLGAVREKLMEAEAFSNSLTDAVVDKLDDLGKALFGDFAKTVGQVKEASALIGRIVSYAKTAFDLVRAAICGTGVGCIISAADKLLGLIDLSPIERLAERVLGTCYGQTLLGKVLMSFGSVANLPKMIAKEIVDRVKGLLPGPAAELLCDTDKMVAEVKLPALREITCGRGGSPEAVPGPAADGSYKGDWTPPDGYPDKATKAKLEKLEAEEKAAKGTEPPPSPPKLTPGADNPGTKPPAPTGGAGVGADQTQTNSGRSHSVRKGLVDGDGSTAIAMVYLYVEEKPPFDPAKEYDAYASLQAQGVAYGPDLIKVRLLSSPKKGSAVITFESADDYVFEVREGEASQTIGLPKGTRGDATLEAMP